jgi:hypothetical protein
MVGYAFVDSEQTYGAARRARRYRLAATIELTDLESEIHLQGLTIDLSFFGCGVAARKAFSAGTKVRIRIIHRGLSFAALGRVIYFNQIGIMGIDFAQVEAKDAITLENWIGELRGS